MKTLDAGKAYRQHLIQSESLPDIFIQAYDRIVTLLHAAAAATEARDIEAKTHHLNQAFDILGYLQGALDFEHGGEVAAWLNRFYALLRRDVFKASVALDAGGLRRAADQTVAIRRIWEQAQGISGQAAAAGVQQPQAVPPSNPTLQNASPSGSWSA